MWAVLPIKDMADAKQRLSPVLAPVERRALFRVMVGEVLAALAAVRDLDGILVVTRDPAAMALAQTFGARVVTEPENCGQSSAVSLAAGTLVAEGVDGMLAVPGDIPLVTADELETALRAHKVAPAVTIVPAWDRRGSNCLICSPPDLIPFAFGNDSFQPHLAAACAAGVDPGVVPLPGIGLDIDNPDDLRRLLALPHRSATHAHLRDSGIAARLMREQALAKG